MAMRSSGGTGVLIALIIFIFLTVGSATAAILLYGQKTSANEELSREKAVRTELMRESERESVATLLQEANRQRQSLVGYMVDRSSDPLWSPHLYLQQAALRSIERLAPHAHL